MKEKWGCQSDPVQETLEIKMPSPEWSSLKKVNYLLETELHLYLNWASFILYYSEAMDDGTCIWIGNEFALVEVCDLLAAEELFFVTLIRASSFPMKWAFLDIKRFLDIWLIWTCTGFYSLEEFGIRNLSIRQKHDNNNYFDSSYCIVTRVQQFLLSTIIIMPLWLCFSLSICMDSWVSLELDFTIFLNSQCGKKEINEWLQERRIYNHFILSKPA